MNSYLVEGVNLNGGLGDRGESPLGTLASAAETAEGTSIIRDVELRLPLELVLDPSSLYAEFCASCPFHNNPYLQSTASTLPRALLVHVFRVARTLAV